VHNYSPVGHLPPAEGQLPAAFVSHPTKLCEDCSFLKFGGWAADISYGENTDKMGGWWIASNAPVTTDDMPITGTARYEGLAVGTLAERAGNSHIWQQTPGVTGDLAMDWDFAKRAGWLQIDDFGTNPADQKSFGGPMFAPSRVDFGGIIASSGGIGAASGSFVGANSTLNGPGAPKGVMGNFGIAGGNWKANGIFGGGLKSFTPGGGPAIVGN
jgi:hypothetical protein